MRKTLPLLLALGLCGVVPVVAQEQDNTKKADPKETQAQRIERLIQELGADGEGSYDVRESAQKQLETIGRPALAALKKATKSKDLEVASRASEAITKINKGKRGVEKAPEELPQDELRRGAPQPIPQPDMDEVLKELERQMPQGLGKLFRQLFDDGKSPAKGDKGDQDEERRPDGLPQPKVRTWTWQLNPNGKRNKPAGSGDELGLGTGPCSAALRSQLGIPKLEGRVINRITPGGYAERHGLKLHDVLISVDGRAVRRNADLMPLKTKGCKVEIFRKAKLQALSLPRLGSQAPKKGPALEKDAPDGRKQRSF